MLFLAAASLTEAAALEASSLRKLTRHKRRNTTRRNSNSKKKRSNSNSKKKSSTSSSKKKSSTGTGGKKKTTASNATTPSNGSMNTSSVKDTASCQAGAKMGNGGTGSMDIYGTENSYWCTVSPAKEKLRKLKQGVGRGPWCGWKATLKDSKYTCGTCLEVTCDGNVGYAVSVDSNDYDANQFMDVHNNDGSGFWDKVCPGVNPPDICSCSWKVVEDSHCYNQ